MKKIFIAAFLCFFFVCRVVIAQTYLHATSGMLSSNAGACMVNTCTGTYYDDGGSAGKYSNNIIYVYHVFCPNTAGQCIKANFTAFEAEPQINPMGPLPLDCYYDFLTVGDGSTQNSPLISIPGVTSATYTSICGTPAVPFSVTANNTSGCLSFRFYSDDVNRKNGWAATLSCVPCAIGPTGTENNDCAYATEICSDSPITSNFTGPGIVPNESCTGCTAGGENYSNWFTFTVQSSGTLGLNITPDLSTDDYDFALYGPGVSCGSLGTPVRCSYAENTGTTGMSSTASDFSEDVSGNGFVSTIAVTAGQTYYLMVNCWTPPVDGYTLDWVFSGGASLDCSILPITLSSFTGSTVNPGVLLQWETLSEKNNDFFILERSGDGENFQQILTVDGKENSTLPVNYVIMDNKPLEGTNYYRLSQQDMDGSRTELKTISVDYTEGEYMANVSVYDISGHLVLTGTWDYTQIDQLIAGADLESGLYIYKAVLNTNKTLTGKYFR